MSALNVPPKARKSPARKPSRPNAEQARLLARRAVIDECGDLVEQLAPHKAAIARLEAVKKTIRAWYADEEATGSFTAFGDHYRAILGPKGNQTSIEDMQAVYEAMGHEVFLKSCTMTMGALEAALGGRAAAFTTVSQTGSRSLVVTPLEESE